MLKSFIRHLYHYQIYIFKKLSLTSINIHCKSLVEKYIEKDTILDSLCLAQFIANYDTKTCKICKCVIFWACFNVHTNPKNHCKELLLLFYPFCE
jgi:hypothetical protein